MLAACATDATKLAALLADSLPAQEADTIRAHLAHCKACQDALDRLTDEPELASWYADFKPGVLAYGPDYNPSSLLSKLCTRSAAETPHYDSGSAANGATISEPKAMLGHVGSFRLLAILGRGGMGVVYKAYDPELRRLVAVKVVPAHHLSDQARTRFMREARAAAGIHHEHVVAVHAVVCPAEGIPYLVMQFIDGQTLRDAIQSTRGLPPREAARLVREAALGVSAAHRLGLIHRDIKPGNILVDASSKKALVVDFGLVRSQDSTDGLTQTGTLTGTPEYMSPEQIRAPENIDARADVYALGATLYEALTGSGPFHGTPHMVLQQVLHDEPVSPRRLSESIPADLETICLKAMAKEPARRYAAAQDFADDLRRWLDGEPILARPVGSFERSWRWCRRNPRVAFLTGSVVALLLVLAAGASMTAVYMADKAYEARELTRKADESKRAEANSAEEATERLWGALLAEAEGRRWSGKPGRNVLSMKALTEAARIRPSLELRNEAIACMVLPDVQPLWKFEVSLGFDSISGTAFDGDLAHFAYFDPPNRIRVLRVTDQQEIFASSKHAATWLLLSPNCAFLSAYHPNEGITVWNVKSKTEILRVPRNPSNDIVFQSFTPDGGFLTIVFADNRLHVYELANGRDIKQLDLHAGAYQFSPQQTRLAVYAPKKKAVDILDWPTGQLLQSVPQNNMTALVWHPAEHSIVCLSSDRNATVWDLESGQAQSRFAVHTMPTGGHFNHGGDNFVSSGWDHTTRFWDPMIGKEILQVPGGMMRFSRDDRRLAYIKDREIGILEVEPGRMLRTLHPVGKSEGLSKVSIHPQGRLVASAQNEGVRLWDRISGKQIAMLPTGVSRLVHFLPSGKHMLTFSARGIERWPLNFGADNSLTVGPAELACPPLGGRADSHSDCSPDGRWGITFGKGSRGVIVDLEAPANKVELGTHDKIHTLAVSPDGQWAVSGTQYAPGMKIWNARTGRLEKDITSGNYSFGCFSPNGRWLVTDDAGEGTRIWETGAWNVKLLRKWPARAVFSSDSRIVALPLPGDKTQIELVDPETGLQYATLTAPFGLAVSTGCFSADGGRFIAHGSGSLLIWDLVAIRGRLRSMGLDWNVDETLPASVTEELSALKCTLLAR